MRTRGSSCMRPTSGRQRRPMQLRRRRRRRRRDVAHSRRGARMSRALDAVVVGLGAMGSAVLSELAARGRRVIGFDRFAPPHELGSSHGKSRIIREAYFEDPRYVPLVQRAYVLWRELERATGTRLMLETGGLMVGPRNGAIVRGAKLSADTHGLPYKQLDGE